MGERKRGVVRVRSGVGPANDDPAPSYRILLSRARMGRVVYLGPRSFTCCFLPSS
jgi:hypothetical protein